MNITRILAIKSGSRPKTVIAVWVLVFALSLVLAASLLGDAITTDDTSSDNPESIQAETILKDRLHRNSEEIRETIIVRSESYRVTDPEYEAYVTSLHEQLLALGPTVVLEATIYYQAPAEVIVSDDRRSLMIPLLLADDGEHEVNSVHRLIDEANANEAFGVVIAGEATLTSDFVHLSEEVLRTGEMFGIGVALVILAIVFGALISAVVPIILAIFAIGLALGIVALLGQAFDLFFIIQNMVTMMGLAVGIDYSLFILSRYREERENGLDKIDAIGAAGGTAGRAVVFSGMTVVLALLGLVIFPQNIFWAAGLGAILVVFCAILASMTLLPAVIGLMGDKVNRLNLSSLFRGKAGERNRGDGFWTTTTRLVTARPVISLLIAVGFLVAIALPFAGIEKGMTGVSALPDDSRSKQGFMALQADFGWGQDEPAVIVIDGRADSAMVRDGIAKLESTLRNDINFATSRVETYPDANLSVMYARFSGDPMSKQAMDSVSQLRDEYIPEIFGDMSSQVMVTGQTAETVDFNATTDAHTPLAFAIVLGLSFVLLAVAFRSIVIPITSILMNLLSVGAAYGMIVLVFQKGIGASLLGFQQVDVIESWLPIFLFAVLFGLSMDYQVFLISRIKESFMKTGRNDEAIAFGLQSTGKLITGAALIMVAIFGGFALGDMAMFQQIGFGLAIAVFMDATIVRLVVVPATMRLCGKWNWYFPTWLEWLPNISIGEDHIDRAPATRNFVPKIKGKASPVLVPVDDDLYDL